MPYTPGATTVNLGRNSVDNSGSLVISAFTSTQQNITPSAGSGVLFTRLRAGRVWPDFEGPDGYDTPLQPHMGSNRVSWLTANMGAATFSTGGLSPPLVTGTLAASTWATTNFSSALGRVDIAPAGVVAGTTAGVIAANPIWWFGNTAGAGGWFFVHRGIVASGSSGSTFRFFAGFQSASANPTNADPSANFSTLGVGKDAADTNYFFMHSSISGAANKINTGIPYNKGDVLEIRIYAKPNGQLAAGSLGMSLEILSAGGSGSPGLANPYLAEWTNTGSAQFPALTSSLAWKTYIQTTTGSIRYGFISTYVEVDN